MKESKFKIGDVVNYLPKISGLNPKKQFVIEYVNWMDEDLLSKSLGVEFEPTWVYSFENNHLSAEEKDLKLYL